MKQKKPRAIVPPRMFAIQARDGRSAVVFRQGPNKQFLLCRWWLDDDRIEEGQWVKSKIYVRRCDLSPDGEMLVYFAARYTGALYSWTAISRPPYFTALALWPKTDTWGGGGLFKTRKILELNHKPKDTGLAEGHKLPASMEVRPLGEYAGQGENGYIENIRMLRDGWRLTQEGNVDWKIGRKPFFIVVPHFIHEKANPKNASLMLRLTFFGIGEGDEKHIQENYEIVTKDGNVVRKFELFDWADWALNGDLLLVSAGCVFRLPLQYADEASPDALKDCKLVIDLSDRNFIARISPDWAQKWPR